MYKLTYLKHTSMNDLHPLSNALLSSFFNPITPSKDIVFKKEDIEISSDAIKLLKEKLAKPHKTIIIDSIG